ncbi:MAG: hypothetical protein GY725_25515 [bacterium]|nr:hypothetical protein [bacterium]
MSGPGSIEAPGRFTYTGTFDALGNATGSGTIEYADGVGVYKGGVRDGQVPWQVPF